VAGHGRIENLPILAEDARMGRPATRQVDLTGGTPLAFQAAVGKWVRAGSSVQKGFPLKLEAIRLHAEVAPCAREPVQLKSGMR
jgi:hypothetical protein